MAKIRPAKAGSLKPAEAKALMISAIQDGLTVAEACRLVGKSEKTYEYYRSSDVDFKNSIDLVRAVRAKTVGARDPGGFEQFCPDYLGQQVFAHQLQWVDLLEGRPPRGVHPAMTYEPGRPELLVVNTPPEHAKSTTITTNYVTYRICKDPNVRIIVVSKTKEMAKKFVYQVKNRLTHPRFAQLQIDFAPAEGFKASADTWTTDMLYLGGEARDSGEKDPTLLALGMGGQIYGARADLIVLDDCVTLANAHEFEKQIDWIAQEVLTRLSDTGKLLVVGTRVAPVDLYQALRDVSRYPDGVCPYTYFAQPAVLEFAPEPKDWKTLWPATNEGDRIVPKWDGAALHRRRGVVPPRTWAMVYMQQQVHEDATFPAEAVKGAIDGMRRPGLMSKNSGVVGVRPDGMDGLYIVAGLDPAAAGYTAMVVVGVDRVSKRRWVLEVVNQAGMTPTNMRQMIKDLTVRYGIHEWRIEKNAFQTMLTQDAEIREFLGSRGCVLKEHHTGCVPTDVQILTRDGWRTHDQLELGQEVLTHRGWEPLLAVNLFDAPEKMYAVDTPGLSTQFTAEHRHLVQWRGNSRTEDRILTTEELKSNTPIRLTIDPVDGPGIGGVDVAALLGWYVCEGSVRGSGLAIAQSPAANPEKWAEIRDTLDRTGWTYSIYTQPTADRFYVHAASARHLLALAPGRDKRLTVQTVAAMTSAERTAFIGACLKGDGCGNIFFNTEPHLIEAFEAACVLNGYAVRRQEFDNGNGRFNKNKTCWSVTRKSTKLSFARHPQHDQLTPVPGVGRVWCPTTPSGTWVALANGRSFVTGNSNKWDADFGVASMALLFDGWRDDRHLIRLPSTQENEPTKALVEQLITWAPQTKNKTDAVMALWFAEIRAREICDSWAGKYHLDNPYLTSYQLEERQVVNLDDYWQQAQAGSNMGYL